MNCYLVKASDGYILIDTGFSSKRAYLEKEFVTLIFGRLGKSNKFNTFKPDIYLEEGRSLSEHGFNAEVLHLPDHSKGSIGILTTAGDLLYNMAGFSFIDTIYQKYDNTPNLLRFK